MRYLGICPAAHLESSRQALESLNESYAGTFARALAPSQESEPTHYLCDWEMDVEEFAAVSEATPEVEWIESAPLGTPNRVRDVLEARFLVINDAIPF